jgi:predicted ester cyclase
MEENKRLVKRFFEAVSGKAKPRELLAQFVADEELIQHILMMEGALPHYEIKAEDLIAEGDKVGVRAKVRAEHRGALMGIAPTGREVSQEGLIIYEIAGGRIVRHWMRFDRLELLEQIGSCTESN